MACSQPFLFNPYKKHPDRFYSLNQLYFPCGWCLNCRVDKSNSLRDRCEYEYIDKKCGAFITLTYDDNNLIRYMQYDEINNKLVASLSKKACKDFLNRLNKNVHKHENNLLCNHNYKYLIVGEYGEHGDNPALLNRPHYHLLVFGLDFAYCKKIFADSWQGSGNIFIGSIGAGAISYVLKYLDKQLFGELAKEKYDNHGMQRPFQWHSLGLGSNLFKSQQNYILEHDFNYRWKGHDTPVPIYYRNKFWKNPTNPQSVRLKNINNKSREYYEYYGVKPKSFYDLKEFGLHKAKIRETNIKLKLQQSGKSFLDIPSFSDEIVKIQRTKYGDMPRIKQNQVDIAYLVTKARKIYSYSISQKKLLDPIPF